ncbi:MAG: hypothetical protein MI919_39615, partial [Holophagales bacterium]|nr:hypothetical protein [Holophagales bacterium]
DAVAHFNHRRIARKPNPSPRDWVNDTDWWRGLAYRTGHYFFDTNRDWFAHTQEETRHRIPTIRAWRPQVLIDAHEQGRGREFFFDPPTEPYGPHFPPFARRGFEIFGAAYAAAFDVAGFEYQTGEAYNYFYPGYTTSWGSYQGAVGMLFEQGSSRGLALERPDESVRTLGDALEQQYTASWAAVRTAAGLRRELLDAYVEAHREAIAEGEKGIRHFLLPGVAPELEVEGDTGDAGDPGHRRELAALLLRNGIEVGQLTEAVSLQTLVDRNGLGADPRTFPAGTLVVSVAQPRAQLVRVLLEAQVPIAEDFLAQARERLDRGENPRFYDITAFSLPLLFDLPAYGARGVASLPVEPYADDGSDPTAGLPEARYAYLFDGRDARAVAALHRLTREGYRGAMLFDDSRLGGEPVSAGTTIVRVGQNPDSVHQAVRDAARELGVAVRAVDTGLAEPGYPSLGSGRTQNAHPVEVAILAELPIHGYSFGWTWYVLEEQYHVPTTVLRTSRVARLPLDGIHTLVIPDLLAPPAELASELGEGGMARLKAWIRDGGNLVALGRSVDFVRQHLEMGALRSWVEENTEGEGEDAVRPRTFPLPGSILGAEVDRKAWLAAGVDAELPLLVGSDRIYLDPEGPPSGARRVVARYAADNTLLSGHAWPESLEHLPGAIAVYEERVGSGRVILFAEDPTFRAYHRGPHRLFLNAVLFGPNGP